MKYIENVVISRVGEMKYLESEIVDSGSPFKVVTLTRDSKLLSKKAQEVAGLPLTIEHSPNSPTIGKVATAWYSPTKKAIVGDIVLLDDRWQGSEISLGYEAFVEHIEGDKYKLIDFVPNHVSVTERGRCGTICKI